MGPFPLCDSTGLCRLGSGATGRGNDSSRLVRRSGERSVAIRHVRTGPLERCLVRQRHRQQSTRQSKRSEEHTSELQSLMRISYAVFCLKNKKTKMTTTQKN